MSPSSSTRSTLRRGRVPLTTIGIVLSVLFESIRFFSEVSFWHFITGTEWNPAAAFGGDTAIEPKFGAVPLFLGTFVISLIATVLAIAAAFFIARTIVNPLRQLSTAAQAIGAGEKNVSIPTVKSEDEIGDLARAFNTMSQELGAIYESLEDRIASRTADLEVNRSTPLSMTARNRLA